MNDELKCEMKLVLIIEQKKKTYKAYKIPAYQQKFLEFGNHLEGFAKNKNEAIIKANFVPVT